MPVHKRIEWVAKLLLALVASALLWRPGRKAAARAALAGAVRRVLLVRIDDRVGEALLTTPLIGALAGRQERTEVHVLAHPKVARVLDGLPGLTRVIAFDRRRLWLGPWAPGIRAQRRERYDAVVNCANWEVPSVTSALVSRLVAAKVPVIGPAVWPIGRLMDVAVAALPGTTNELAQRRRLLAPLGADGELSPLRFRAPRVGPELEQLVAEVGGAPHAVVNPGGRLGWRRIPPEAFAAAARALSEAGRRPLITWGPGEEALAREVAAHAPGAFVAPPTSLDELAALMAAAGLTVCNNTGPMHLSVAVGAPTLALFLKMDPARWGHAEPPHHVVDLTPFAATGTDLGARVREETLAFAARVAAHGPRRAAGFHQA